MDSLIQLLTSQFGLSHDNALLVIGFIAGVIVCAFLKKSSANTEKSRTPPPSMITKMPLKINASSHGTISFEGKTFELDGAALNEIQALLQKNDKIQAIKKIREVLSIDLKDAKNLAEALERPTYKGNSSS